MCVSWGVGIQLVGWPFVYGLAFGNPCVREMFGSPVRRVDCEKGFCFSQKRDSTNVFRCCVEQYFMQIGFILQDQSKEYLFVFASWLIIENVERLKMPFFLQSNYFVCTCYYTPFFAIKNDKY